MCYFLVSMCDHADPHLLVFRLHILSKSANDPANNHGSVRGIKLNYDQQFCLQSTNPDNQNRNNGHMDESG